MYKAGRIVSDRIQSAKLMERLGLDTPIYFGKHGAMATKEYRGIAKQLTDGTIIKQGDLIGI